MSWMLLGSIFLMRPAGAVPLVRGATTVQPRGQCKPAQLIISLASQDVVARSAQCRTTVGWLMLESHSTWRCCTRSRQPGQQTVAPSVSRIRAHAQHAPFSGGLASQPHSSLQHRQQIKHWCSLMSTQHSISCTMRACTAAPDSCDDTMSQSSCSPQSDTLLNAGQSRWRTGVRTASVVAFCAAAASLAAAPALADAARSQLLTGPVVPGVPSRHQW